MIESDLEALPPPLAAVKVTVKVLVPVVVGLPADLAGRAVEREPGRQAATDRSA